MTARTRALAVVATLVLLAMLLPAALAYTAGLAGRLTDLERRVDQLELEVHAPDDGG